MLIFIINVSKEYVFCHTYMLAKICLNIKAKNTIDFAVN